MTAEPVALSAALDAVDQLWDPRIVTTVNDYDVRVAAVRGEFVWHVHDDTDEFFLVVSGELRIGLREGDTEREVTLPAGSVFTVPRGVSHRPASTAGAQILLLEPTGTVNTGDRHDQLPEHLHSTAGRPLDVAERAAAGVNRRRQPVTRSRSRAASSSAAGSTVSSVRT